MPDEVVFDEDCVFCRKIVAGGDEHGRVYRVGGTLDRIVRFVPLNPVTPGHMLFVPRAHFSDAMASPYFTRECTQAAAVWGRTMREAFNLITNVGAEATQTVKHLHIHYVPRRADDGLKLPWSA